VDEGDGPQGANSNPDTEVIQANNFFGGLHEFLYRFPTGEGDYDAYFTVVDNGDGSADVEWDLTGSGKELWAVGVKSADDFIHWYSVTDDQHVASGGVQVVTAPANIDSISHISFFDKVQNGIPDTGSSLSLLGLGLFGLGALRRYLGR
jgi:hypothetical protein